jgi:hypothetical protein
MKTPRRTEPPAAPIECPCGNTIHFSMGAPDRDADGRMICASCKWGPVNPAPVAAVVVEAPAPVSETRPAPRSVVPLTSGETITALAASVERVAPPPSVTARDLERHEARMRKAGMAPVTRDTCDPHERRFFSVGGGR